MSFTDASTLLTSRQAAELVGRSPDAVKAAAREQSLRGRHIDGFWRFTPEDVVAWDATATRKPRATRRAHERSAELLAEYGSVTPYELATFQGIHVGNARKYLALLAIEGRAHRHDDGEWFPGSDCQQEEAAS